MGEGYWPAGTVEHCAEPVIARRAVSGISHVIFAGPDDFDRSVGGFRDQRGFDSVVVFQPAAEPAAEKGDVDFDFVGINAESLSHRVANILRHLGRRPDVAAVPMKISHAVSWLHGRMRHEGKLVFGFDAMTCDFADVAG